MGVLRMGVLVTGCPKKNPYDSHSPKLVPKLITGFKDTVIAIVKAVMLGGED